MFKKIITLFFVIVLILGIITGCNTNPNNSTSRQANEEVTDLQLALLNHILVSKDALPNFLGKEIEGQNELIDDKFKRNISGGDTLVNQLKGFKLIDFADDNANTGFKAAAFMKGNSIVIVYSGTEEGDIIDIIEDIKSGLFDYSLQDIPAKKFAISNVEKYRHYNLYITGYSLGARLCYIGTEAAYDNALGGNLKKVRTFNGLGVKEFIRFEDSNLSNIHNLQTKFGKKTFDYIVDGDIISDENADFSLKRIGYNHIGTEFKVPCTNEVDGGALKQHDMYSIIDYLLNNPAPAEDNNSVINLESKSVLVVSPGDHNLIGEFINVSGDTRVSTWNTFVSKYPQIANPMNQGKEYFSKMHITLFFLKDSEGNVIDSKGVMNATGFGSDPVGWKDKFGEFDWMYNDIPEEYETDDFFILFNDEYFSGPANCHIINARLKEYVTLGEYEQDGEEENGKEPIEWLILKHDNDRMFVVSKYCLDYLTYPDDWTSNISWETSSLRNYLNDDFIKNSFSNDEQQMILQSENQNNASEDYYSTVDGNQTKDRVFLMSIDEVQTYLPSSTSSGSSKRAYGTNYLYSVLKNHPAYGNVKNGDFVNWALRADIDTSKNAEGVGLPREIIVNDTQIVEMITTGGLRDPDGPLSVIRPAMWINSSVKKHRNANCEEVTEENNDNGRSDSGDNENDNESIDENNSNKQSERVNDDKSWSDMYYDLIVDSDYMIEVNDEYNTKISVNNDIPLALHDFDMNGTPELIIGYIGARLGLEVFTIYDGDVKYAGSIGGKYSFFSDKDSYHGIFRNDSWAETQVLGYSDLSDGKLIHHEVINGKFNQSTKQFDYTILDETLYDVYLDCTTSDSDEISTDRQAKNELKLYYWRDIESNGWNSFIAYYGY